MATVKVFIDKGHGGNDPGAVNGSIHEADLVDSIGNYLVAELKKYANVETKVGPRPSGTTGTQRLAPRPEAANAWGANLFVSLHINAGGGTGGETLHSLNASAESIRIAGIVNTELAALNKSKGLPDRGVKRQDVHVLRKSNMPAILVEFAFIDRASDIALLKTEAYRKECAQVVAAGIVKALKLSVADATPAPTKPSTPSQTEISIVWNGKTLSSKGLNIAGQTYLPARTLGELAGFVIGYKGGKVTVDDVALQESINVNGTGFVRSTELAKAIGYVAVWGGKEQTIYMTKKV